MTQHGWLKRVGFGIMSRGIYQQLDVLNLMFF